MIYIYIWYNIYICMYVCMYVCICMYVYVCIYLVGGFKHDFYFPSYMGCHPSH